jgi:hypothetical protein
MMVLRFTGSINQGIDEVEQDSALSFRIIAGLVEH